MNCIPPTFSVARYDGDFFVIRQSYSESVPYSQRLKLYCRGMKNKVVLEGPSAIRSVEQSTNSESQRKKKPSSYVLLITISTTGFDKCISVDKHGHLSVDKSPTSVLRFRLLAFANSRLLGNRLNSQTHSGSVQLYRGRDGNDLVVSHGAHG